MKTNSRLTVISGPSCVGKGPLLNAIARLAPELPVDKIVLFNDRSQRRGEVNGVDYHFTNSERIQSLSDSRYIKVNLGSDAEPNWQALDLKKVGKALASGKLPLLEAHHTIVKQLRERADLECTTVFLSPLSMKDIRYLSKRTDVNLPDFVADVMRRKLLRRTAKQNGFLSLLDLQDIEKRAKRAPGELRQAHLYDYVIPNHDGEDSDNWDQFYYPIGDARVAFMVLRDILAGRKPSTANAVETWKRKTFPR